MIEPDASDWIKTLAHVFFFCLIVCATFLVKWQHFMLLVVVLPSIHIFFINMSVRIAKSFCIGGVTKTIKLTYIPNVVLLKL